MGKTAAQTTPNWPSPPSNLASIHGNRIITLHLITGWRWLPNLTCRVQQYATVKMTPPVHTSKLGSRDSILLGATAMWMKGGMIMAIAYEDAPGIKTLSQIGILLWHMVYYLWDLYSEFSSQSKCLRRITKLLWLSDWPKIPKEASWPRGDLNLECGNLCSSKQYW